MILGLNIVMACNEKKSPQDGQRNPAAIDVDDSQNALPPRSLPIEHFVDDSLKNPATRAAVEAELKNALLRDPTQDSGEPLVLSEDERALAKEGLDKKLLQHTENAIDAARELGQMSRGLLGNQKIQFSSNEDFRCVSVEDNPSDTKSEVLISKPIVGSVTLIRFRPHQGFDPSGGSDFATRLISSPGKLVYESDQKVSFWVDGSLAADAGAVLNGHLKGTIQSKEVDKDFICTKGVD